MEAFAVEGVTTAHACVVRAIKLMEDHAATEMPDPAIFSAAFAEMLEMKSHLAAILQFDALVKLQSADTERPSQIRMVK